MRESNTNGFWKLDVDWKTNFDAVALIQRWWLFAMNSIDVNFGWGSKVSLEGVWEVISIPLGIRLSVDYVSTDRHGDMHNIDACLAITASAAPDQNTRAKQ